MDEEDGSRSLFGGVVFAILPSDNLSTDEADTLSGHMQDAGGQFVALRTEDQSIERLEDLTHIIATNIDFPQYNAALTYGINVVKPSWVTQSIAKGKTAQPRQHSPDPCQYFNDVVMSTGNLPESDKDALIAGLIALGGQYSPALSKLVTHIVTQDPTNDVKCRVAKEKQLAAKIVLPHWFDDCFKLGKKISEAPYMFPDPEILRGDHNTSVKGNPSPFLEGAVEANPKKPLSTPPSSPSALRKRLNAFVGKKVMLSEDLELHSHMLRTLGDLIGQGGGEVTEDVDEADIYIGQWREGEAYVKASRDGKEVGNLSWLYHVINRNQYTSPLSRLLHYPVPHRAIPGFESMIISVSNYQGEARVYLENLVSHCGAKYTKTMKENENTHLITAHLDSAKVEAAQSWGINIVNHIWLEESYAKFAEQSLSNPRYNTFPARTNLGEVAGHTRLDMNRMGQEFFNAPRDTPKKKKVPLPSPPRDRAPITTFQQNLLKSRTSVPKHAADGVLDAGAEGAEEDPSTVKKPRGRPPKTAMTPRLRDDEKENESPLLTASGRASKAKAIGLLYQQADDIALFNKEMKRKGGVTHGGRRSEDPEELIPAQGQKPRSKKRNSDEIYEVTAEGSDLSDGETQPSKPAKKAKSATNSTEIPPIEHRMMITGDDRWVNNSAKESSDTIKLRRMGIKVTTNPKEVDILVAPKILRTRKFAAALAAAPMVIDPKYLDVALKTGRLHDNIPTLQDTEGEARLGFKLVDALERAKVNRRRLLHGWTIFISKEITGGFDAFKEIISLNGGDARLYQGRTGLTLPKQRTRNDPNAGSESQNQGSDDEFDYVYLVSGETAPQAKLWKAFDDLAAKQGLKARIVSSDWLLNVTMRQEVIWDDKWLLHNASGKD